MTESIPGWKSLWLGLIAMQAFPSSSFWSLTLCKMDGRERHGTIYHVNDVSAAQSRVTVKGYFLPKSNFCMKKTRCESNPMWNAWSLLISEIMNWFMQLWTRTGKIDTAWKGFQIVLLARRILLLLSMLMSHNKCFKCIFFYNISDKRKVWERCYISLNFVLWNLDRDWKVKVYSY